jgi:hypothetical protein
VKIWKSETTARSRDEHDRDVSGKSKTHSTGRPSDKDCHARKGKVD